MQCTTYHNILYSVYKCDHTNVIIRKFSHLQKYHHQSVATNQDMLAILRLDDVDTGKDVHIRVHNVTNTTSKLLFLTGHESRSQSSAPI